MPTRKYTYYDFTLSLCPVCLKRIDAKIVFEDNKVYMLKRCPEHGQSTVIIADDVAYYKTSGITTSHRKHPIPLIQKRTMDVRMTVACVLITSSTRA
jgi:uncharacterized radical SAM superfamily Fe-S cluster-containing enzyme